MPFLHLESQLAFYKAYHNNRVNVAIHIVFVPVIAATLLLFLTNTPSVFDIPHFPLNGAAFLILGYLGLYVLMEPVAGFLMAPIAISGVVWLNRVHQQYGAEANKWAAIIHVFSWIVQFIGHGLYEGRAPALLDNLAQALFLAPFFVWFEILFALGYRPELQHRLEVEVQKRLKDFNAKKEKKAN